MIKLIFKLVIVLMVTNVNAVHIGNVTIKRIRVMDSFALVETNENMITPACATNKRYFYLPLTESQASNRKLSILMAAKAQKSIVNPNCVLPCRTEFNSWLGDITACGEVSIQ